MEMCCVNYKLPLSEGFFFTAHFAFVSPPPHTSIFRNPSLLLLSLRALQQIRWLGNIVSPPFFPINNLEKEGANVLRQLPCWCNCFVGPLCSIVLPQPLASCGNITQANRAVNLTQKECHPEKKGKKISPVFPLNAADLMQL